MIEHMASGHATGKTDSRLRALVAAGAPGDCVLWDGGVGALGYGRGWVLGRRVAMHRRSWELFRGPIPTGMFVCHSCDVRACVNPAHLFVGTAADNNADMVAKGRNRTTTTPYSTRRRRVLPGGPRQGNCKLTEAEVSAVRSMGRGGVFVLAFLADFFGISKSQVRRIKNGHSRVTD